MTRTLIVSDVHANLPALDAVLEAEPGRDAVVFLGDAVDCGPHPEAVCERLRRLDVAAGVRGNHDQTVLEATDDSADDPYARWQAWTRDRLSPESRTFLDSLDRTATVTPGERSIRLHHGDFPRPDDHEGTWSTRATPDDEAGTFAAVAARYDEDVIVHGHSHYPFEATVAGTTFVNPGSVGLQRPDRPVDRAHYAVLADGRFDLRSVEYDARALTADLGALESPFRDAWERNEAPASTV